MVPEVPKTIRVQKYIWNTTGSQKNYSERPKNLAGNSISFTFQIFSPPKRGSCTNFEIEKKNRKIKIRIRNKKMVLNLGLGYKKILVKK